MSKPHIAKALSPEQVEILDQWYAFQEDKLHVLLACINKASLIPQIDTKYRLKPDEAETLLMLSETLSELIKASDKDQD